MNDPDTAAMIATARAELARSLAALAQAEGVVA